MGDWISTLLKIGNLALGIFTGVFLFREQEKILGKVADFISTVALKWRLLNTNFHKPISRPPGSFILLIGSFFYSEKTYETVFLQMVNDMRDEYFSALHCGRIWKARWIRVRYGFAFLNVVGLKSYFGLMEKLIGILKGSS